MQKKIIALAVAGLVSGAAFAQSNVTVYGTVDMAYVYQGGHNNDAIHSYSALDDGGWDSSRFGLKGTEDLGNGLSANFVQEYGTNLDTKSDGFRIRNSYVSLAGKSWGEVKLGSFGSVHDDYGGWSEAGGMSWGHGVMDLLVTGDAYNAVEYISPSFSGLQFKVGYSSNYQNTQDQKYDGTQATSNIRAYFGSVAYANGPLQVALSYDNANGQGTEFQKDEIQLSGGYDFGVVKLGLGYDYASVTPTNAVQGSTDDFVRDSYRVVLGVPVGPRVDLAVSYASANLDRGNRGADYEADGWGLSGVYKLSKRTNLYAAAYFSDADHGYLESVDDGNYTFNSGYDNGFKMGVRHQF